MFRSLYGGSMKALILISILAISFQAFADEELPVIGEEQADEEVLAIEPSNEVIVASTGSANTTVSPQNTVLESKTIDVDGYMKQKPEAVTDRELQEVHSEINRQKKEIVLNKAKAQQFKELGKSTEQLSETTEDMLLEKRAVQQEIANYNLKVKCLQMETPGPECDKVIRKRR